MNDCKTLYEQRDPIYDPPAQEACQDKRFWDHEELRASLRSLVKFAPFFNPMYPFDEKKPSTLALG